jgi:GT2 family glycosyltransferase
MTSDLETVPPVVREAVRDEDVVFALHGGGPCAGHASEVSGKAAGMTVVICTYRRASSLAQFLASLRRQNESPQALVIVDASPDDETQRLVAEKFQADSERHCVLYLRVSGRWKGLTRQRNYAVRWVGTNLVAFFDDDVVLMPECLAEMLRIHRGSGVVGVGAVVHNEGPAPNARAIWRLRRRLGIVRSLEPGRYSRSGMSTPWGALPPSSPPLSGDWLPGCGMMWKTEAVAELRFNDAFQGYSLCEDVDFSLRARQKGKLIMAPAARLTHFHPPQGRLDDFRMGYFTIYNRFEAHRRGLSNRTWRDVAAFAYAWSLDSLILLRHLASPTRARPVFQNLRGRLLAAGDLLRGLPARASASN